MSTLRWSWHWRFVFFASPLLNGTRKLTAYIVTAADTTNRTLDTTKVEGIIPAGTAATMALMLPVCRKACISETARNLWLSNINF